MSDNIPSQNEEPLCRCKALYLGTSLFNPNLKRINESSLNLSQLQDSISERYPIDGSNFAKGIQTWLTVYPSGIQMEHSSSKDLSLISALFYYPIKSLVYCGALRFISNFGAADNELRPWKFAPLDTEIAQQNENLKNPPLFVVFLKGVDPNTKRQIIECHVFVVGMIKTSMKLIESCQKAFNLSKESVTDFFKKFGNVPVVYCMKNDLSDKKDKRVVVKNYDVNGYFYATENTPIEVWQLYEENEIFYESISKGEGIKTFGKNVKNEEDPQIYTDLVPKRERSQSNKRNNHNKSNTNTINRNDTFKKNNIVNHVNSATPSTSTTINHNNIKKSDNSNQKLIVDPYEKSENLIKVEKRVDPITGQNIYVRYFADTNKSSPKTYDLPNQIYDNGIESERESEVEELEEHQKQAPIIIRQEKTPSPIIVEKYIKKKAPQVIIKEIHVHEPAPPPVKIIQTMDNEYPDQMLEHPRHPIYNIRNPGNYPRPGPMAGPRLGGPGNMPYNQHPPFSVPQIRMTNPNNLQPVIRHIIPNSGRNQVYGTTLPRTSVDYRINENHMVPQREPYTIYSNLNRNNYQRFNTEISLNNPNRCSNQNYYNDGHYDFGQIRPRFIDYENKMNSRNSTSLRNINHRFSNNYPRHDEDFAYNQKHINDKYSSYKPNPRKIYTEHTRVYKAPDGGKGVKVNPVIRQNTDLNSMNNRRNYRDHSSGRLEIRQSYKNY